MRYPGRLVAMRGETPIGKFLARPAPRPGREYGATPLPTIVPAPPKKPKR
jgi:hypothetical protein